nr:uncharacterized protein LOC104092515 isoform X3 [Nicotiana tomentosiformis]
MASSFSLHQHIHCFSPTPTTLGFTKCPLHISTLFPTPSSRNNFLEFDSRRRRVPFAVTESDSSKSLEPDPQILLQDVADSFVLPADYFSQLPRDLRLDLNDAAFDLSNGPIKDEMNTGMNLDRGLPFITCSDMFLWICFLIFCQYSIVKRL